MSLKVSTLGQLFRSAASVLVCGIVAVLVLSMSVPASAVQRGEVDTTPSEGVILDESGRAVDVQVGDDGEYFWVDDSLSAVGEIEASTVFVAIDSELNDTLEADELRSLEDAGVEVLETSSGELDDVLIEIQGDCTIPLGHEVIEGVLACAESGELETVSEIDTTDGVPEAAPAGITYSAVSPAIHATAFRAEVDEGGVPGIPNEDIEVDIDIPETEPSETDPEGPTVTPVPIAPPSDLPEDMAAAPASQCNSATSKVYYKNRFFACFKSTQKVTFYKSGTRVAVGSYVVEMVTTAWVVSNNTKIWNDTSVRVTNRIGAAKGIAVDAKGTYKCFSSGCASQTGTFNKRLSGTWLTAPGTSTFSLSTGVSAPIREYWSFTLTSPTHKYSAKATAVALAPRCDNNGVAGLGRGCVYPAVTPIFTASTSGTRADFGKHVKKAIASGLPSTLTRATTATNAANRAKACPSSLKRDAGYQCDEYPFASSKQGAAAGGKARVFSGCRWTPIAGSGSLGWSRCMIRAEHNLNGGADLNAFYRLNRVLVNDKFSVKAV